MFPVKRDISSPRAVRQRGNNNGNVPSFFFLRFHVASAQEQRRVEKGGSCAWKKKKRKERKSQCSARVSVFFLFFFSAFLAVICLTSAAKWSRETEIPLANPALSASAGLRGACDEGSRDSVPAHDSSSWEGRKRAPKKNIHTNQEV